MKRSVRCAARTGGGHGPGLLLRRVRENGVDPGRIRPILVLLTSSALAWPGLRLEGLWLEHRGRDPAPGRGPLFILGHYRSGTTLLHKLLAADPRLAALSTFDVFFPGCPVALQRMLRPPLQRLVGLSGIRHPYFHDYRFRLDDPNETEAWLLAAGFPWSSYWGYLFPRRPDYLDGWVDPSDPAVRGGWLDAYDHALRRLMRRCGGRPLVVKDPPNTARAGLLAQRYPSARFVYLFRDPSRVLLSVWRLWRETIEPLFGLQTVTDAERCDRIASHYSRLLSGYERDRPRLTGRLVELRYEDFVADPVEHVRRLYGPLGLGDFGAAREAVAQRLSEDWGYREAPSAGESLPEDLVAVAERWRRKLGYDVSLATP